MTAFLLRLLTGVRARWVGFDPEKADPCVRVFYANHTSHLDAAVIWASLPPALRRKTRPVAAADYWNKGLRKLFAEKVFRALLIERRKITRWHNPIADMEAAVTHGGSSLILFPEGTRADCDAESLNAFRPGIFHLAKKCSDVEFVPVYLENLNRILPKGDYLLIPLLATAYFGSPIRLMPDEDKDAFLARAKAAVEALRGSGEC